MKKLWVFSWFLFLSLLVFARPALAQGEPARVKIISAAQSIELGALSAVFTMETQGADGAEVDAATTTRVSLVSTSQSGKFYSSPANGPCGAQINSASVTIAKNTSHKSFCYSDVNPGVYTISLFIPDQSELLGDSQEIVIVSASASATTTPDTASPSPKTQSSAPEYITKSVDVKIYRFLPNPQGDDAGKEWVEIKNSDSRTVALDGWLLDDKDAGQGPASDAFTLSGSLASGEVKRFNLPLEAFALNNSGGDEVNLYFGDKVLAHKAVYSAAAYDDGIFEFREGQWQPPTINPPATSGGGGGGVALTSNPVPAQIISFKLNEIFPNPLGEDQEKEWVEIYNPTSATATLQGYFLADGESDAWSEAAWSIPKNTLVPPLGVLAILLPKDSFTLNNSGKEKVKLFSPQKQLLDSASYEDAEENKSWAKNKEGSPEAAAGVKWGWAIPTFNAPNDQLPEALKIVISEILPRPTEDEEEFVELLNAATTTINLEGAVLQVGSRKKIFEKGAKIKANGFLAIYEDDLPSRLNNSGQTIKLIDPFGRPVTSVEYGKAEEGMSYASLDGENFVWTGSPTPGKENQMVLGAEVSAQAEEEGSLAKIKTKSASGITSAQAKQILVLNKDLKAQLALMQGSIEGLEAKLDSRGEAAGAASGSPLAQANGSPKPSGGPSTVLIFIPGLLVLAGVIFVLFRYLKF